MKSTWKLIGKLLLPDKSEERENITGNSFLLFVSPDLNVIAFRAVAAIL